MVSLKIGDKARLLVSVVFRPMTGNLYTLGSSVTIKSSLFTKVQHIVFILPSF